MPLCYSVVFEKLKSNGTIKGFFCFISKLSRFLLSCPSPCVSLYEKTIDIFLCPTQSPTEVMEHTGKRIKEKDRGPIKYSVGAAWPALALLHWLSWTCASVRTISAYAHSCLLSRRPSMRKQEEGLYGISTGHHRARGLLSMLTLFH